MIWEIMLLVVWPVSDPSFSNIYKAESTLEPVLVEAIPSLAQTN